MPARNAVGLDIGTSSVRAAELSYGRDGVTLEKFGQVALPPGAVVDGEVVDRDAVRTALKSLWKGSGFTAKRVALGVANQRVVVRQIDLPWMTRSELKESLALQVQDYLPMAVEDSVLDFHVTEELNGPDGRQLRGLLVAAARETVMSNVAAVQDADLRVTSVDLTSFAVLRSAGRRHSEVATEALLDIGSRVSNLVIHSGGTPRFVRILLSGGQDVTDAVAERLGVPAALAEALKRGTAGDLTEQEAELASSAVQLMTEVFVDEIRSSLDYYGASNAQFPVERILLSGGGSLLHGLAAHLEQVTRRPVQVADVLGGVRVGRTGLDEDQLAAIHPLAAVPVGLALGVIS